MSLMTNNGKILTVEGKAINKKEATMLEVENLINKKIIDLGTFSTNRPIEEGLKEFFIAAENLNLDYYDNRIFIGMVADVKVMAIGQAGGDLAVYTEKFEQYKVGYDDADLLAVRHEPSKVRNVGAFETRTIEDGLKQFALEVVRNHKNYNKYGTTTCLYTGEIAVDIPVFTWYNGDNEMNVFVPNTTYKVSNLFDEENITITDISSYSKTEVDNKIWQVNDDIANNYMELESMIEESRNEIEDRANLVSIIGNATETLAGVMSTEDKKNLNTLVALLQDDKNNIVDTIAEVLAIFEQYPEGANLVAALASKADKADTYTKPEVDAIAAGAGGESLVIDMGTYTNDSNEEALKELFVSIKNKALPITTNYIYTAKVNGFKVKGMFNNISLKLDTNLQENDAEVKYEVYYDDEDNLLVNKWFVPIYSETNSFTIYGGDAYFSVSPDDHFIEFYSEYGNFILSSIGMAGEDSQGNSYDIEWSTLERSALDSIKQEIMFESEGAESPFMIDLWDTVNTNFNIIIEVEGPDVYYFLYLIFDAVTRKIYVYDNEAGTTVEASSVDFIDGCVLGGTVQNWISFYGGWVSNGTMITITYRAGMSAIQYEI